MLFLYICQAPPHFQLTEKSDWNSEKVNLVVCDCLPPTQLKKKFTLKEKQLNKEMSKSNHH